jgi:hypothetical protein
LPRRRLRPPRARVEQHARTACPTSRGDPIAPAHGHGATRFTRGGPSARRLLPSRCGRRLRGEGRCR